MSMLSILRAGVNAGKTITRQAPKPDKFGEVVKQSGKYKAPGEQGPNLKAQRYNADRVPRDGGWNGAQGGAWKDLNNDPEKDET